MEPQMGRPPSRSAEAAAEPLGVGADAAPPSLAPGRARSGFARNLSLGALFELFFITAVASLLLIRGFLALSGFPQVGGGGLHIAHMLWGGLLMLASLLLLLGFIGHRVLLLAAFLSGVGFGTFIDELGKFITSDNDYFFRPAIAVIYVLFVLLFLVARALESRRRYAEQELLANAFDITREAVVAHRRPGHTGEVLAYLRRRAGGNRLLLDLKEVLEHAEPAPPALPRPLRWVRWKALQLYASLVDSRGLDQVLAGVFVAYVAFLALTVAVGLESFLSGPPRSLVGKSGIAYTGLFVSNALSALLILTAAWRLRTSRLAALLWFDRAVAVDLLLGQVFAFYLLQFGALFGVALDVAVLVIVRGAVRTLRDMQRLRPGSAGLPSGASPAGSAEPARSRQPPASAD